VAHAWPFGNRDALVCFFFSVLRMTGIARSPAHNRHSSQLFPSHPVVLFLKTSQSSFYFPKLRQWGCTAFWAVFVLAAFHCSSSLGLVFFWQIHGTVRTVCPVCRNREVQTGCPSVRCGSSNGNPFGTVLCIRSAALGTFDIHLLAESSWLRSLCFSRLWRGLDLRIIFLFFFCFDVCFFLLC